MMRTYLAMLAVLPLIGCDRVVDLDVEEGPKRLVVEGRIERNDAGTRPQRIRLSLTDQLTRPGALPPAVGAQVELSDGTRQYIAVPSSTSPGIYLIADQLTPAPGTVYTLTIDYQGERYRAVDTVLAVAPIDSLYFEYREESIAGDAGFRSVIDYTDPPTPDNHYLWELLVNDSLRIAADFGNRFRMISHDRFYNGNRVLGFRPYDEEIVSPGDRVTIRQIALSAAAYRYYAAVLDQSVGNDGSPFAVPPASVRGNVANLTNPASYPLGYFLATGVSERTAIVPARLAMSTSSARP